MFLVPFVAAGPSPTASACVAGFETLVHAEQLARMCNDFAGAHEMRALHAAAPWPRLAAVRQRALESIAEAERLARIAARAAAARKGRALTKVDADSVRAGGLVPADTLARADRFGWSRAFGVDSRVLGEPPARVPLTASAEEAQAEALQDCTRVVLMPPEGDIPGMVKSMRAALSKQWVAREQAARKALAEAARAAARAKAQAKADGKGSGRGRGRGKKGRGRAKASGGSASGPENNGAPEGHSNTNGLGQPGGSTAGMPGQPGWNGGSMASAGAGGNGSMGTMGMGMGMGMGIGPRLGPDGKPVVTAEQFRLSAEARAELEPQRDIDDDERTCGRRLLIVDGTGNLDATLLEWMGKVPTLPSAPSDGALEGCPIAAGVAWLRGVHRRCLELLWNVSCAGDEITLEALRAAGLLPS